MGSHNLRPLPRYRADNPRVQHKLPQKRVVCFLLVCSFLAYLSGGGSAQQIAACSPSNSTPPLSCTPGQWVRVTGELYAPQVSGGGANCQLDLTSCNTALFSAGLEVNCNGPVLQGAQSCSEEVNVTHAREQQQCLEGVPEVAALVQYSCVKGTDVYDLCSTTTRLTSAFSTSFQMVYMASPAFPASAASGHMCSCHLQGSKLRVQAVEVNVDARLPWQDDVTSDSYYAAVLSIRNGGQDLYRSNDCADCTSLHILNTILVSTHLQSASELTIAYSDFGLNDQNVWLEITELGPELNISCTSTPLPSNRVITTTTTAASTTATTTTTTSATTQPPPTARPASTGTSRATPVATPARPTPDQGTGGGNGRNRKGGGSGDGGGGGSDDSATVVVLVVLLLLLMVGAGVLGFILYRRRGKCQADGKRGLKPMLVAWYRDLECSQCCRRQTRSPADGQHDADNPRAEGGGEFDGAAVGGGAGHTATKALGSGDSSSSSSRRGPKAAAAGGVAHSGHRAEVVETDDGETTIFHNELYQAHRELVEEEVARMKQHKREQRDAAAQQGLHRAHGDVQPGAYANSAPRVVSSFGVGANGEAGRDVEAGLRDDVANHPDTLEMQNHYYETVHGPVPAGDQYEQNPDSYCNSSGTPDSAREGVYEDVKGAGKSDSPQESSRVTTRAKVKLKDESKSRARSNSKQSPSHSCASSTHSGSEQSINSVASHGAGSLNNQELPPPPPTQELLSPEERDMFEALGLSGQDEASPSADTAVSRQTPKPEAELEGNFSDNGSSAQFALQHRNGRHSPSKQGAKSSHSKSKKASKPELVSDILEMSLRDIKEQRKGQGSEVESGGENSDGREAEEVGLGGTEGQVQMSEC